MNMLKGIEYKKLQWIDKIEASVDDMLWKYALRNWFWWFQVLQRWKTMKSAYGKVAFHNWPVRYFKVSQADRIRKEVEAYKLLPNWSHQILDGDIYLWDMWMYVQDFFHWRYWTCIMEDACQMIVWESSLTIDIVRDECRKVFEWVANNYRNSRHTSDADWANDIFYKWRVLGSASWIDWYGKLLLNDETETPRHLSQLYDYPVIINGINDWITIGKMFQELKNHFWWQKQREMVLSQWDLTENNITLDGNFYDFETWWVNSLWQDMWITVHYFMIAGHYITPKYSNSAKSLQIDTNKLLDLVSLPEWTLRIVKNKELHIHVAFMLPEIKRVILSEYLRVMKIMWLWLHDWFHDFKMALVFRFLASKNLASINEKDRILLLSLALFIYSIHDPEELLRFINL